MTKNPVLFDLHEDLALYYHSGEGYGYETDSFAKDLPDRQADLPKYERANVRLVFSSVFPLMRTFDPDTAGLLSKGYGGLNSAFASVSSTLVAQMLIKIYYRLRERFRERILLVERPRDLLKVVEGDWKRTGLLISLEGTEALAEPSDLEIFARLGVRSLQFTWNFDTKYASSCMSEKDYGLTGAGEKLLALANERGIILDLAHAGRRTCLEVLESSRLPVVISHSNAGSVFKHRRNTDDDVLDALKKNGGVIGFTLIPDTFGKPRPAIGDLVRHIRYVRDNFGSGLVAIGTDYFGLFPPDLPPAGLEDISKLGDLWRELKENGFDEGEIESLSCKNALRVIEKNMPRWTAADSEDDIAR